MSNLAASIALGIIIADAVRGLLNLTYVLIQDKRRQKSLESFREALYDSFTNTNEPPPVLPSVGKKTAKRTAKKATTE